MEYAHSRAHISEIWLSQTRVIVGEVGLKESVRDSKGGISQDGVKADVP